MRLISKIGTVFLILTVSFHLQAITFTENFTTTNYKDTTNTTTDWPAVVDGKDVTQLRTDDRFAETTGVVNWGGAITEIDYNASTSKWLIGGYAGKLNLYDGFNYINLSSQFRNTLSGEFDIGAIANNGSYWLIGASAAVKLAKYDGTTWTDLSSNLTAFTSGVTAIAWKTTSPQFWLVGGKGGALMKYDGTTWTNLTSSLGFSVNITDIGWNGSEFLIAGENGKISRFDGLSTFTDISSNLSTAWSGSFSIFALDWSPSGFGNIWLVGGAGGKLASLPPSSSTFADKSSSVSGIGEIQAIEWNGSYWLIGGYFSSTAKLYTCNATATTFYSQTMPSYFLTEPVWAIESNNGGDSGINFIGGRSSRYLKRTGAVNSPVNTDASHDVRDFGGLNIQTINYNGSYWLIGGVDASLNSYNGYTYSDLKGALTSTAGAAWGANDDVLAIGSNGSFWLIGGIGTISGRFVSFDGSSFANRASDLGFGSSAIYMIEYDPAPNSNQGQWVIGGANRKLAVSSNNVSFTAKDVSAYFGAADSIRAAAYNTYENLWYIGGDSGVIITYDPAGDTFSDLTGDLAAALGGSYRINAITFCGGILRVACDGARIADKGTFGFDDMSGYLTGFGSENVYSMDCKDGVTPRWFIGGGAGRLNRVEGASFTNETSNLVNFSGAAVNAIAQNSSYFMLGGDYAKLNRYGAAFVFPGWAYSILVDPYFAGCATMYVTATTSNMDIEYFLSANNGTTWKQVTDGVQMCFSGPDAGSQLKWRAKLNTYDAFISPYIDTLSIVYTQATPTITPTFTNSATASTTPTITPTWTGSPTNTITMTTTLTVTRTVTPTISITSTGTVTPSVTGTITDTATITVTPTISLTITGTTTPSVTRTITQTITPSVTRTVTETITQTVTQTVTQTFTGTVTGTVTETMTETVTRTITATVTGTVTQTATPSVTATISLTVTRTITATASASVTHTVTMTITLTATPSVTLTVTKSVTETVTATVTRTATPTVTGTVTRTTTATVTGTISPTITRTVTETVTPTITRTVTTTVTGTITPSITRSVTATITATISRTVTSTITETVTQTITPTYTPTKAVDHLQINSPASVTAGSVFYITVTAMTSDNLTVENYFNTVEVTTTASNAIMPGQYTYVGGDNGSHIFEIRIYDSGAKQLFANDLDNSAVTYAWANITVLPAAAVSFSISAPSTVYAGTQFYITVTAKDVYNNVVTNYTNTASFSSTDPQVGPGTGLPGATQFTLSDAGVKILPVTLKTKGIQLITAREVGNPSVTGNSNGINVLAGSVYTFDVTAPSQANAGVGFVFTAVAKDQYGNTIDDYTGTVAFTSNDGAAVLPANYTYMTSDMGSRIFPATLNTAGVRTITVTQVGAPAITGISNNITVTVPSVSYARPLLLTSYLTQQNHYEYVYMQVDDRNFTFTANRNLEYDVFVSDTSSNFYCSMEFQDGDFPGGTDNMRDYGQATQNYIRDQNLIRIHPSMDIAAYAKGNWYHRKFDVSMLTGAANYYSNGYLSQDTGNIGFNGAPSNNPGMFNAFFDNIVYTNTSGTIMWDVYSNSLTMNVGAGVVMRDAGNGDQSTAGDGNPSWYSNPGNYPLANYVWVIDGWKGWATPSSGIVADGTSTATLGAYVWTPNSGSNTKVAYAIIDFDSDRAEDVIAPVKVSLNAYAVTDWDGNAYATIKSTKAGPANVTLTFGPYTKIVTVNFVAGPASRVMVSPSYQSMQTNVSGTLSVKIADVNGNFVSDARGITLTSDSGTMVFSQDNGNTWATSIMFAGTSEKSVLVRDSTGNTATVTAAAPSLTSGNATVYVNNGALEYIELLPLNTTTQAGVAKQVTVQAKDSSGNNTFSNSSVTLSSPSSTMYFSPDNSVWYKTYTGNLNNGTMYVYYKDTVAASYVTISADAAATTNDGKAYATITANVPYDIIAWADKYAAATAEYVTVHARVVDYYNNVIAAKWVSFTALAQNCTRTAYVMPYNSFTWTTVQTSGATAANGEIAADFKTTTCTGMNYCVVNTDGLLGKTITLSAGGTPTRYAFLPSPMSLGADKIGLLTINCKDANGYNVPAASGHRNVLVYTTITAQTFFSINGGTTWYNNVTTVVDDSGQATVNVRYHYTGSYGLNGSDQNGAPYSPAYTTLTVSTGYFLKISPDADVMVPAGSYATITAQIIDQNGNNAALSGIEVNFSTNIGALNDLSLITDANGLVTNYLLLSNISNMAHYVTATMSNPSDTTRTARITSEATVSFLVLSPTMAYKGVPFGITVQAVDAYGQIVDAYINTVTFGSTDPLWVKPANYGFQSTDHGIKMFSVTFNTNGTQVISVTDTADTGSFGYSGNILVVNAPTATVTQTVTKTITPTLTVTRTVTRTATQTITATITRTITDTVTPTVTRTITLTPTETITRTVTRTVTDTVTPTITRTATNTVTETITRTVTRTVTETVTATITRTVTLTATETITRTNTATVTESVTPSVTATVTATVTQSATQTVTQTITQSATETVTGTITGTVTITSTSTVTQTITPSFTVSCTYSVTPSWTNSPEFTATVSPTITWTATQTVTGTITRTATRTITETVTGTVTRTVTETVTPTVSRTITLTVTQSMTPSVTRTITLTVTPTATASITVSVTQTVTLTVTPTVTMSWTVTHTQTITQTWTITQTATEYISPTITPTSTATPEMLVVYPNPFNRARAAGGTLKIEFLPPGSKVRIYTITSFLVFSKNDAEGRLEWDGKNMAGEPVAPGIYFYRIETANDTQSGKIYIVR